MDTTEGNKASEFSKSKVAQVGMTPYPNLMFDLETLGRQRNVGIVEIGYCTFSHLSIDVTPAQELMIPVEQNLLYGFPHEQDCIKWWLEEMQREKHLSEHNQKHRHATMPQILSTLAKRWDDLWFKGVKRIWCNGTDFDIPILQNAFDKLNVERPIILRSENFHLARDSRTFLKEVNSIDELYFSYFKGNSRPHRAAADAHAQAYATAQMFERIRIAHKEQILSYSIKSQLADSELTLKYVRGELAKAQEKLAKLQRKKHGKTK